MLVKRVQYYAVNKLGQRQIMSFTVSNELGARKYLTKFSIPSGWYVVRNQFGNVVANKKIDCL